MALGAFATVSVLGSAFLGGKWLLLSLVRGYSWKVDCIIGVMSSKMRGRAGHGMALECNIVGIRLSRTGQAAGMTRRMEPLRLEQVHSCSVGGVDDDVSHFVSMKGLKIIMN
ncbi:hypothetical protein KEM54_002728 [Ascosphaera aggregata]|nr:hypothetical protein KEM54_002728 [Ascosphaera aggregata]